jgi:hypothetical protein
MLDQRLKTSGDRRAGGVVARGGDDDVVGHGVHVGQRLAIDARIGDRRREVLGRVSAASRRDRVEVPEHVDCSIRGKSDSGTPINDMITNGGKFTATSWTKSHSGTIAAMWST